MREKKGGQRITSLIKIGVKNKIEWVWLGNVGLQKSERWSWRRRDGDNSEAVYLEEARAR